jgi:predicted AAA+ superfamily ATPase
MALYPRRLASLVMERTRSRPVTVLTGSRQTGKTTLARDLLPSEAGPRPVYVTLDDPDERLRLAEDPVRRLDHGSALVVLDEIQKVPALLDVVKLLADRRMGHRFLLLGSSQILLMQKVRESLAGRAALLELWPLALSERTPGGEGSRCALDAVWEEGRDALDRMVSQPFSAEAGRWWRGRWEQQLTWGGYPALEPLDEAQRGPWLRDFRRTYLERDLSDLGRVADLDQFALAQRLLACRTAQLLSLSEVARDLGVVVNTVKKYLRFLEISYQTRLLRPLLPTMTARLVKSPRLHWTDPGLARMLADRFGASEGALFETAVFDEVLRWSSWQAEPPTLSFHRTHAGREIDLLVHGPNCLVGIEVKSAARAHPADARALLETLPSIRAPGLTGGATRTGLVVTQGREVRALAQGVWEVPVWRLFAPESAS